MLYLSAKGILQNVIPVDEFHGEGHRLACTCKVLLPLTNGALAEFHPDLRSRFYKPIDSPQVELKALFAEQSLCSLVFKPISNPVFVTEAKISKIVFAMEEGGTVKTSLNIYCHPSASQISRLCELLGQELDIVIEQQDWEVKND